MRPSRLLALPFAVSLAVNAQAQGMLEEVIVTATKRAQTLQEVPVAVSVVAAETIERAEIRDLLDLQSVIPSLRVSQLQNSTQTNFIIRGFGNGANNPGIEPSVAVFVDGVYRSRSQGRISDLPNIERIEVLRGPQSTLYGKNASAGVISVVTSKPSLEETTGNIEVGAGNYSMGNVRGYVTGPITDSVAYSFGGAYFARDGYTENPLLGTEINERDRYNVRGELYFVPSEKTDVRVIFDYDELDEICCSVANLVNGPAGGALAALAGGAPYDAEQPFTFRSPYNRDPVTKGENFGASIDWTTDFDNFTLQSITAYRDSFADQPFGDIDYSGADVIENNPYTTDIKTFTQEFRLSGSMERLDWTGGLFYFDEEIEYSTGVTYGQLFRPYAGLLVGGGNLAAGEALLGGLEASLGIAPGTFQSFGSGVEENGFQDNQTLSLFAQFDYRITDRLTATVGISYLDDEKDVELRQTNTDVFSKLSLAGADGATALTNIGIAEQFPVFFGGLPFSPENIALVTSTPEGAAGFQALTQGVAAAVGSLDLSNPAQNPLLGLQALQFLPEFLGFPNAGQDGSSSDSKTTYTLRLAMDLTDNINMYTSFATGYKASSWNISRDARPTADEVAAVSAAGEFVPNNLTLGTRLAGPEDSEVFEFGAKVRGDWGYANIAIFDQTIEGFQSNVFIGTGFLLANAGEQTVTGAELDLLWQATDNLRLGFSTTILNPKYESFTQSAFGDISGTTPAGIHEVSYSASATYDFTLGNNISGYFSADYQYDDRVDIQDGGDLNPANLALGATGTRTREVGMLNTSLGFNMGDFELRVWARNLNNDQFLITNFASVAQAGSFSGYPNQPRTYGANLRYSF